MMYPKQPRKRRRKTSTETDPEKYLQMACEQYLELMGLRYIRIPDAVWRYIYGAGSTVTMHMRGLISSYLLGLPDLTILIPNGRYLCVELKRKGGRLRQGQKKWSSGYVGSHYYVIDDFNAFRELVDRYREKN